jgi:hypothetical protein
MFDLRNKLELFAVKTGLKSCFLVSRDACESKKELNAVKQIATLMKLKYITTINPPLYYSRKPKVKSSFLQAYYDQTQSETLWVYCDPLVKVKIDKCISGKLNEGYVLGYPECCIRWHEECRTLEVESEFHDLEGHIVRNPFLVAHCQIETEADIYKYILGTAYPKEENEKIWKIINQHLIETYRVYPYVPHWACSACLEGKSKETEKLNAEYKNLSEKIDKNFQKEFLVSVKQAVRQFEKGNC